MARLDAATTNVEAVATQEAARVMIEPDDADGDPENGHQVTLTSLDEIAVTVTAAPAEAPAQEPDASGESPSQPSGDDATVKATSDVRIIVRNTPDGRVEFAIPQRATDTSWGERLLPSDRFLPVGSEVGRWLFSSALRPQPSVKCSSSSPCRTAQTTISCLVLTPSFCSIRYIVFLTVIGLFPMTSAT